MSFISVSKTEDPTDRTTLRGGHQPYDSAKPRAVAGKVMPGGAEIGGIIVGAFGTKPTDFWRFRARISCIA